MNKRLYYVQMEVSGDFGMFARSDSGSNPTSYVIPTVSAAKGMFESVFLMKSVAVIPVECKICSDEVMCEMPYNSHSPFAKKDLVATGSSTRIMETVLFRPTFQLTAIALPSGSAPINPGFTSTNVAHAYQAQFIRHLNRGDFRVSVNLGQEHMLASYCGPFREGSVVRTEVNKVIKNLTVTMYDRLVDGQVAPVHKDVVIRNGVAEYLSLDEVYNLVKSHC